VLEEGEVVFKRCCLFRAGETCPERIEGGEIVVG
jgi:hypothetical protein